MGTFYPSVAGTPEKPLHRVDVPPLPSGSETPVASLERSTLSPGCPLWGEALRLRRLSFLAALVRFLPLVQTPVRHRNHSRRATAFAHRENSERITFVNECAHKGGEHSHFSHENHAEENVTLCHCKMSSHRFS